MVTVVWTSIIILLQNRVADDSLYSTSKINKDNVPLKLFVFERLINFI